MRLMYTNAVAEVDSLPGCSQVAVIHSAFVCPSARGNGAGTRAHAFRLKELAQGFMYDAAICTSDRANEAQNAILRKHGWQQVGSFVSRKTGHTVLVWFRGLVDKAIEPETR